MYTVPRTLAHYAASPFSQIMSTAQIDTILVGKSCQEYHNGCSKAQPDAEAVTFYCLNHLAALVREKFTPYEKLPEWAVKVMDAYDECLSGQSVRMFYYLLLITTRESRHMKSPSSQWWDEFKSKYGMAMTNWYNMIKGGGSEVVASMMMETPPSILLGQYTKAVTEMFFKGSYSGGYGGPKWGEVAKTLNSCVQGQTSMEMMVDTGYTLSHNNGPIFNKGMMYHMYTNLIKRVLDVQRSGQIPQMVIAAEEEAHLSPVKGLGKLRALVQMVRQECPGKIGTYVDWHMVEKLGSVMKYPNEKKLQDQKYGVGVALNGDKTKVVIGHWKVMADKSVVQFTRVKKAS